MSTTPGLDCPICAVSKANLGRPTCGEFPANRGRTIAMTRITRRALLASAAGALLTPTTLWADEPKVDVQENIRRGLEWLAKNQNKTEGCWEAHGGQYPTTMTGLAGMAMLMEGSTMPEGKYSQNIKRAVEWFMKRSQPNGLLGNQ